MSSPCSSPGFASGQMLWTAASRSMKVFLVMSMSGLLLITEDVSGDARPSAQNGRRERRAWSCHGSFFLLPPLRLLPYHRSSGGNSPHAPTGQFSIRSGHSTPWMLHQSGSPSTSGTLTTCPVSHGYRYILWTFHALPSSATKTYCRWPKEPRLELFATTVNCWRVLPTRAARRSVSAFDASACFPLVLGQHRFDGFGFHRRPRFQLPLDIDPAEAGIAHRHTLVDTPDELPLFRRGGEPDLPEAVSIVIGDMPEDVGEPAVERRLEQAAGKAPEDEPGET